MSEAQNGVTVVKGAINVNIGEASGGVPVDILDPSTGIKLIDIEIAGQSPFELMPLGALPYRVSYRPSSLDTLYIVQER